jgi:hypothetical protein
VVQEYAPNDEVLKGLEESTRTQKLGVWVEPNPVSPWELRKARAAKRNTLEPLLNEQSLMSIGPSGEPLFRTAGMDFSFYDPPSARQLAHYASLLPPASRCARRSGKGLQYRVTPQAYVYAIIPSCLPLR